MICSTARFFRRRASRAQPMLVAPFGLDVLERAVPVGQAHARRRDRVGQRVEGVHGQVGRGDARDHGGDLLADVQRLRHAGAFVHEQGRGLGDRAPAQHLGVGDLGQLAPPSPRPAPATSDAFSALNADTRRSPFAWVSFSSISALTSGWSSAPRFFSAARPLMTSCGVIAWIRAASTVGVSLETRADGDRERQAAFDDQPRLLGRIRGLRELLQDEGQAVRRRRCP